VKLTSPQFSFEDKTDALWRDCSFGSTLYHRNYSTQFHIGTRTYIRLWKGNLISVRTNPAIKN